MKETHDSLLWQPQEIVDIGNGCQCGITTDDHCYIVLTKNIVGSWTPSRWIPPKVAKRLGELAANHCMSMSASTLQ